MSELTTAARPYARAVFEIARENSSFDIWSERLMYLASVIAEPSMNRLLAAPNLTHEKRAEIVEHVASDQLDKQGANLVKVLAENGRLRLLADISKIFEQYRADAEGLVEASVISAYELDKQQIKNIMEARSKRLQRQVKIVASIDPDLIAGAIIRAGDLIIDGSVKGRLQSLTQQITD